MPRRRNNSRHSDSCWNTNIIFALSWAIIHCQKSYARRKRARSCNESKQKHYSVWLRCGELWHHWFRILITNRTVRDGNVYEWWKLHAYNHFLYSVNSLISLFWNRRHGNTVRGCVVNHGSSNVRQSYMVASRISSCGDCSLFLVDHHHCRFTLIGHRPSEWLAGPPGSLSL